MLTPTGFTAFSGNIGSLTRVTPFTHRDNATFLRIMQEIILFINETLRPEMDSELQRILDEFQAAIDANSAAMTVTANSWQTLFDAFMADVSAELYALNEASVLNILFDKLAMVSVKKYGVLGDGVTDDTVNIQAAIDAAVGRTLYFPSGTYLASQLNFTANVSLTGASGVVLKQKSLSNKFFLQITAVNVSLRMSNMVIDQNNAGQTTGQGKFLFNTTLANAVAEFDNVTFKDFCEGALRVVGDRIGATREVLRVFNCKFRGGTESQSGIYNTFTIFAADASELTVVDSDFDHGLTLALQGIPAITVAATVVDSPDYTELTVRNNRFKGYGRFTEGSGIGVIDSYAWATRMEVTGNKFIGSRVTPIRGKVNAVNGIIAHNIMSDFVSSGVGFGRGISLVSATIAPIGGNFEIASNIISGAPENGIEITHASDTVRNISVHDNIIDACLGVGISVIRAENFNIHDNTIRAAGQQGITLSTCAGVGRLAGNIVDGAALAGIQTIGNQLTLDLHILNNFVDSATASGITCENVRSMSLQGNTVRDVVDGVASGQRGYRIGGATGIEVGQVKNNTAIGVFATGAYTIISAGILTGFEDGNSWNAQKGYANAAPVAGTWARGSIIWNTTPVAGGSVGWVCVTAGTPGTWKTFGVIAA